MAIMPEPAKVFPTRAEVRPCARRLHALRDRLSFVCAPAVPMTMRHRPAGWDNLGVVAQQDAELVIALLAAPTTMIVCFTITEKGYCRAAEDSLDAELAVVSSVFRWLSG